MLFPTVQWAGRSVSFAPGADAILDDAPHHYAVLVFVARAGGYLLADIADRGWSIPGGRMEPGETPPETGRREVYEETGAVVSVLEPVGAYTLRDADGGICAVPTYYSRAESVGPLPAGSESRGIRVVAFGDLPDIYYYWDPMLEAVFIYVESHFAQADAWPGRS